MPPLPLTSVWCYTDASRENKRSSLPRDDSLHKDSSLQAGYICRDSKTNHTRILQKSSFNYSTKIFPKTLLAPWTPSEKFCYNSHQGSINLGDYKFTTILEHYFMGLSANSGPLSRNTTLPSLSSFPTAWHCVTETRSKTTLEWADRI